MEENTDNKIASLAKRRQTIAEEATKTLIEHAEKIETEKSEKKTFKQLAQGAIGSAYNSEFREFLTRDAKGWFKLAACYFIFFLVLGLFFIGLLLVFYQTIDPKVPTYHNKESVMNYKKINPGMGFRPQIDPENDLIYVNKNDNKSLVQSLNVFLENYENQKDKKFYGSHGQKVSYNFEEAIQNTPCSKERFYGLKSKSPCVVVKLNKIFGWTPSFNPELPEKIKNLNLEEMDQVPDENGYGADRYIYVLCDGLNGADKDNINAIDYYSTHRSRDVGGIHFKYFPYRNQENYLSPLVFVHFKDVAKNVLIHVVCKAYASNIDNDDKYNQRGMVSFQLYVEDV